MSMRWKSLLLVLIALLLPSGFGAAAAQVTSARIEHAGSEPQNWLTYGGTYNNQRYSTLGQINQGNVKNLELQWVVQNQVPGAWESGPLAVDGIMYVTQRPNDVMALDAKTGKLYWIYHLAPDPAARVCCGANNL